MENSSPKGIGREIERVKEKSKFHTELELSRNKKNKMWKSVGRGGGEKSEENENERGLILATVTRLSWMEPLKINLKSR